MPSPVPLRRRAIGDRNFFYDNNGGGSWESNSCHTVRCPWGDEKPFCFHTNKWETSNHIPVVEIDKFRTMTTPMSSTSPYTTMPIDNGNLDHLSDYYTWDSHKLGTYFRKRGLGAYFETLQKHKITGQLAPLLGDEDLKEMGVDIVGDRLMFKHHLNDLSRRERYNKRIESIWEGEEWIFFSECDKNCFTCNGFCPVDPSTCE